MGVVIIEGESMVVGHSTKGERAWEVSLQIGWGEGPFACPDGSETGGRTA